MKLAVAILIFCAFVLGVIFSDLRFRSQVVRTYEDGSFVGCYYAHPCRD